MKLCGFTLASQSDTGLTRAWFMVRWWRRKRRRWWFTRIVWRRRGRRRWTSTSSANSGRNKVANLKNWIYCTVISSFNKIEFLWCSNFARNSLFLLRWWDQPSEFVVSFLSWNVPPQCWFLLWVRGWDFFRLLEFCFLVTFLCFALIR